MQDNWVAELRNELVSKKGLLEKRLARINEHHRRPLESDSKERAMQLENQEVVDALGNEARIELEHISAALAKINDGTFGKCAECGDPIGRERLLARPEAEKCFECASLDDDKRHLTI